MTDFDIAYEKAKYIADNVENSRVVLLLKDYEELTKVEITDKICRRYKNKGTIIYEFAGFAIQHYISQYGTTIFTHVLSTTRVNDAYNYLTTRIR